jgi:DNA-binding response OmpR family regulator
MRIAILQADASVDGSVREALEAAGHACEFLTDDKPLPTQLDRGSCGMLVIALPLPRPETSLPALLSSLQPDAAPRIPTLLIAERGDEATIAEALDAGIDDYLIRPLRRGELAMRTRILLRRAYPELQAQDQFVFEDYLFDLQQHRLTLAGQPIALTRKEFELALLLFRHLGRPLSRATMLETVWGGGADLPSRTVDTHVSRVRTKLGLEPRNGYRLAPVYSYGYRLERLPE